MNSPDKVKPVLFVSCLSLRPASRPKKLLKGAVRFNSEFLSKWNDSDVKTNLAFDKDWELHSRSTNI